MDAAGDTTVAQRKIALTTTSARTISTLLCPGDQPGSGIVTATIAGLDPVSSASVTVAPPEVAILSLSASTLELHAPAHTSSTLSLQLQYASSRIVGIPTRVGLLACCDASANEAGAEPTEVCSDYIRVPRFLDSSPTEPNTFETTATLTADGLTFTRLRPNKEVFERDVTIYAYLPTTNAATCASLSKQNETSEVVPSVMLRMTTRDVDAEPVTDDDGGA